jgi:hypothetical protein
MACWLAEICANVAESFLRSRTRASPTISKFALYGRPQHFAGKIIIKRLSSGKRSISSQAATISNNSFFASSFIDEPPRCLDRLPEIWVADGLRHNEINLPAKKVFKRVGKIEQASSPWTKRLVAKIDNEIQVAQFWFKYTSAR